MSNTLHQSEPTEEAIALRAYKIWEERGCPDGDGSENWQLAKEQLLSETVVPTAHSPLKRLLAHFRRKVA